MPKKYIRPVSEKHKRRMFALCDLVKTWSECPEGRQHACILTIDGKWVVSTGFNGVLESDCLVKSACKAWSKKEMQGNCLAIHAESNAIKNCPISTIGLIAYVSKEPCFDCMKLFREFGITTVYWQEEKRIRGEYAFE